jgi:hypothetical protein
MNENATATSKTEFKEIEKGTKRMHTTQKEVSEKVALKRILGPNWKKVFRDEKESELHKQMSYELMAGSFGTAFLAYARHCNDRCCCIKGKNIPIYRTLTIA